MVGDDKAQAQANQNNDGSLANGPAKGWTMVNKESKKKNASKSSPKNIEPQDNKDVY